MMSSKTDYRYHPDGYIFQTSWWLGAPTTIAISKEDKVNWAWPNGLVDNGPQPNRSTKEVQETMTPPPYGESIVARQSKDASIVLPLMNNEHYHASTYETTATSYQYNDVYYGQLMPPFGFQVRHNSEYTRMTLPLEMAEEPVYVNAKQYHGILRRRQSRTKAEVLNKISRSQKKPYLHESRHLHAMRRERGCRGRFVSKKKTVEPIASMADDGKGSNMSSNCYQGSELHLSAYI
ncbi:Nuclear transcription factor Y subunit A-9, partial [Cucurbita argyrosperma subsp. sororia]